MEPVSNEQQAQADDKPVNPELPQADDASAEQKQAPETEEKKQSEAAGAANANDFSFSSDEEKGGRRKKKATAETRKDDWGARQSDDDQAGGDEADRERERSHSQDRGKDRGDRRKWSDERSGDEARNDDEDPDQANGDGYTSSRRDRDRDRPARRDREWDSGRSRRDHGGSQRIRVPSFKQPQFSLRDFENYQDGRFARHEIRDAYNDYLHLYAKEAQYQFYRKHRGEPWFVERYDPTEIYKQKIVLKKYCQYQATQFQSTVIDKMKATTAPSDYFKLSLMQDSSYDYNMLVDSKGKEIELQKAPHFSFDTDLLTLYLKYLPVEVKRLDLKEKLEQELTGFVHLSLSEPMRNHQFSRLAWASFATLADCDAALEKIPDLKISEFALQAVKSFPNRKRAPVRICPPLPEQQINADYELCKMLIEKVFDPEKGIETWVVDAVESLIAPPATEANDNEEKQKAEIEAPGEKKETEIAADEEAKEGGESEMDVSPSDIKAAAGGNLSTELKLDLLILYLRRVHAFCLYCGEEYEDERMLSTRCGPQHIRNHQTIPSADFDKVMESDELKKEAKKDDEESKEGADDEIMTNFKRIASIQQCTTTNAAWRGSFNFLSKYVDMAIKRIEAGPRKNLDPQQAFIDQDLEEFCRSRVAEEDKGCKYSCKFCKKNFKGEHYVINHIKNRHVDQIDAVYARESTQQWLKETIQKEMKKEMKANYYKDENKYFDRPGRRYHSNESSYAHQRDGEGDRFGGDRRGPRGAYQGRRPGGSQRDQDYVDYDDPEVNANMQKQKASREQPDYSDLFG